MFCPFFCPMAVSGFSSLYDLRTNMLPTINCTQLFCRLGTCCLFGRVLSLQTGEEPLCCEMGPQGNVLYLIRDGENMHTFYNLAFHKTGWLCCAITFFMDFHTPLPVSPVSQPHSSHTIADTIPHATIPPQLLYLQCYMFQNCVEREKFVRDNALSDEYPCVMKICYPCRF